MSARWVLAAAVALMGAAAADEDVDSTAVGDVDVVLAAVGGVDLPGVVSGQRDAFGAHAAAAPTLHFALSRSVPEADAEVAPPAEVRLWFTEVPQESSMSVRLIDAAGEPVETGALGHDPEDGRIFFLPVEGTLPAGAYTVSWRAIGQDGHVVRGDFGFTVTAE